MEKDLVEYTYLSDNVRYADLFNGVLFGGKEVIVPERLQGEDTKLVLSSDDETRDDIGMRRLLMENEAYKTVERDAFG